MSEKVEFGENYEFPKEVHNMLVEAQQAHVQFSSMADSKASILMGASFVVFSLTLGQNQASQMTAPTLVLMTFSFFATVLSVLAVLPEIGGKGKFGAPNLLFFGVFSRMDEDEYVERVVEEMRSEERVYRMMARDLHQSGSVLHRHKYRYLQYSYRTFLIGLIATAIAFALSALHHR